MREKSDQVTMVNHKSKSGKSSGYQITIVHYVCMRCADQIVVYVCADQLYCNSVLPMCSKYLLQAKIAFK